MSVRLTASAAVGRFMGTGSSSWLMKSTTFGYFSWNGQTLRTCVVYHDSLQEPAPCESQMVDDHLKKSFPERRDPWKHHMLHQRSVQANHICMYQLPSYSRHQQGPSDCVFVEKLVSPGDSGFFPLAVAELHSYYDSDLQVKTAAVLTVIQQG